MASRPLAVGMRVRVYGWPKPWTGTITDVRDDSEFVLVHGDLSHGGMPVRRGTGQCGSAHPKQIRRLKPREKSARVTRDQLAKAMCKAGFTISYYESGEPIGKFMDLAKALGLE